jgi:hypothetical protein
MTYIRFRTQEVVQTKYVLVVPEDRPQTLSFLINKDEILLGQKAICIRMLGYFFLQFRVDMDLTLLTLEPIEDFPKSQFQSLMKQTWYIQLKLYRAIMEALNTKTIFNREFSASQLC